ncbi:MAG: hypothetical protein ACI94Y_000379 [Maribacter sp.]|jgi:hypothetical protein
MKIKTRTLSVLAFIISLSFFLTSSADNPPDGNTGAPGDGLCNNVYCHSSVGSFTGNVVISGLPSTISPNTTYPITVTVNNFNGGAVKAGFQLVALDNSANNMGMITGNTEVASTTVANGRNYAEHDPAKNFVGGAVSWTFDWTSPNVAGEDLTMYVAGNITDGSDTNSGDVIVTSTASAVVENALSATSSVSDISCNGGNDGLATVMATGGTGGYTYLWSDGQTTVVATNLLAGNYIVTITDSNGATATITATISEPLPLTVNITGNTQICVGDCTDLNAGVFNSYSWSTGATTQIINVCVAGTYTVTVTDNNGCIAENSITIEESPLPVPIITGASYMCAGDCTNLDAGIFSSYSWSTGATTQIITVCAGGTYTVTIADSNDCTGTATLTVVILNGSPLEIDGISTTGASGFGEADGEITIQVTGGSLPYTYNWSNGGTTPTISDLLAGLYSVTVVDSYGCSTISFIISIGSPPLLEVMVLNVEGDTDEGGTGSITIEVTGGVAPYMYSWEDVEGNMISTDMNPTGLPASSYRVFVTDANGNTAESILIEIEALVDVVDLTLLSYISLFPNPAQDEINLEIKDMDSNDTQVIIIDARGREISRQGLLEGNNRINTSLLAEGVYFFRVQIGERFVVKKVVVRK